MEPSQEDGGKCGEVRRAEGDDAYLAAARAAHRSCRCPRIALGLVHEHDGHEMVCGIFPGKSASVSGLLRDGAHPHSADFVGAEEVGLLDCMAFCECGEPDALSQGWPCVHAGSKLPVPDQRHMVIDHMVQAI